MRSRYVRTVSRSLDRNHQSSAVYGVPCEVNVTIQIGQVNFEHAPPKLGIQSFLSQDNVNEKYSGKPSHSIRGYIDLECVFLVQLSPQSDTFPFYIGNDDIKLD